MCDVYVMNLALPLFYTLFVDLFFAPIPFYGTYAFSTVSFSSFFLFVFFVICVKVTY